MRRPELDEPLPVFYRCSWMYGPGNFCGVRVEEPRSMCPKHKVEEEERLAALRQRVEREKAAAAAEVIPIEQRKAA